MTEYGKTPTLFHRDKETGKVNTSQWNSPLARQVKDFIVTEKIDGVNVRIVLDWGREADPEGDPRYRPVVEVKGRSDDGVLPEGFLQEAFGVEAEHELTDRLFRAFKVLIHGGESDAELEAKIFRDPTLMVIYGEGYGGEIRKGGKYSPTMKFRAFDVVTYRYRDAALLHEPALRVPDFSRPLWRMWDEVCVVSEVAKLKAAPALSYSATIEDIIDRLPELRSAVAAEDSGIEYTNAKDLPYAEGIVARTDPYLFDWRGGRVFFKLKRKDF